MQSINYGLLVNLSNKLRAQQKLVRKIEIILFYQDNRLLNRNQFLFRLKRYKDEKQKLNEIRIEFFALLDKLPIPSEIY